MQFSTCIDRLEIAGLLAQAQDPSGVNIDRLAIDSREVGPSDCFVALKGSNVDGHLFIDKAVKNGASAIVSEAGAGHATIHRVPAPAHAHVVNSHRALAELSSLIHSDPGEALHIVATTGTNGKTTVATLIEHVFTVTGKRTGFIGTTGYRYGSQRVEASHTTPSAIELHALFNNMRIANCTHCSMEASSHALDQHRFRVSDIDVAVFTNLTRDHLDYHTTFRSYADAKKRLFDGLRSGNEAEMGRGIAAGPRNAKARRAVAVTNLDDAEGLAMVQDSKAKIVTYGTGQGATFRYQMVENALTGLILELDGVQTRFKLAGRFNASNLTAAYAACRASGISAQETREALSDCPPVEGRMESIRIENGSVVIVDYAHTPDALENVLSTVKESLVQGTELWCVFGCGGERDAGKRPEMGRIAEEIADRVVVTSDNPRRDDPELILNDIKTGFKRPSGASWIVNRQEAIAFAAKEMKAGDTLVLAGKGHETYQVLASGRIHFDDREEAKKAFAELGLSTAMDQPV